MKFILPSIIAIALLTSCASKKSDPNPTPSIVGTWKETRIISITYTNNIATKADTLPVSTTVSNSEFYSTFNADGSYQDYLLAAGVKSSPSSGTYTVSNFNTTFNQSIPADPQLITPDIPARQRANFNYTNSASFNTYILTFQDNNHLTLNYTVPNYPAYDNPGVISTTTYNVIRTLTRVN